MTHPFVMVAPNGARRGKADHPALPVTAAEIVAEAQACFAAGANALHLHVRDAEGQHSLDAGRYREALDELARTVPKMRVQITTESAGIFHVPAQLACLELVRPGWASISVREMARAPKLAERAYALCAEQGTEVQHILYDTDDVTQLQRWQADGVVRDGQTGVIFVLGRYTEGQTSDPAALAPFLATMPQREDWMLCAFGPQEHACLIAAAKAGGACRVGFENSLTDAHGTPWANNAASVAALRAAL